MSPSLDSVRRVALWVSVRLRVGRLVGAAWWVLSLGLTSAAIVLAVHKIWPATLSAVGARRWLVGLGIAATVALVLALFRRLPPRAGTVALDRFHKLDGRLTNAVEFAAVPDEQRTPLMRAAIDDAITHAARLSARKTAPIRLPIETLFVFVAAAGLALVALFEIRTTIIEPPKSKIDPLVMTSDDLELFRDAARELERADQSPETKAAVERFNRLIEDLAEKRLERTEAFRQMEAIEQDLLKGAEADAKALEEEMKETAKQLDQSDLAKKTADALKKNDLEQAKKEMKELAKKLREDKKIDKKQLEKLREALKKASEKRKESLAALAERRSELNEQLLKKKKEIEEQKDETKKKEEERLLKKKEDELQRLDREQEAKQRAASELERLDRELAEAAANLMKDAGLSAEDLEQAAEDLNRMQQEAMSQKDKEELKQKLEELREILRQQGQGGKQRMKRMLKFSKKANGGSSGGKSGKGGDQGEEEDDEGEEGENGKNGKGKNGQGQGEDGEEGEGQGKGKGKGKGGEGEGIELSLGPGGIPLPMPGGGGQGDQPGGQGNKPGQGSGQGGKDWGTGAGGPLTGDKTSLKGDTKDVHEQGLESGSGPSNSQVILSAAEKGFRGGDYKKVFTDYKTVAEEKITQEQVPDGYRFFVQRYFQLIRPRD